MRSYFSVTSSSVGLPELKAWIKLVVICEVGNKQVPQCKIEMLFQELDENEPSSHYWHRPQP